MNEPREKQLSRIIIKGFKSIKECEIDLGNINVLIGANGAGKSNFISAFEMLQKILSRDLTFYTGKKGGAGTLLYNGNKVTDSITMEFHVAENIYGFELEATETDRFLFREERFESPSYLWGDGGHAEANLSDAIKDSSVGLIDTDDWLLEPFSVYQFHDTSPSSRIKSENKISNSISLMNDARNLAAFLYRLKQVFSTEYSKILRNVQRVAPFVDDLVLAPNEFNDEQIILKWKQKGCGDVFNASQFSDGTLRFICLATLLLQPAKLQPATIIIDEPELGLHPYALTIFAELVKKAATKKQIILATQSAELLDHFEPEDVIVVDRTENGSKFKRLDAEQLTAWLEDDYSLGELWNKNLFGGRISR
jgi:predicted ATPase